MPRRVLIGYELEHHVRTEARDHQHVGSGAELMQPQGRGRTMATLR